MNVNVGEDEKNTKKIKITQGFDNKSLDCCSYN